MFISFYTAPILYFTVCTFLYFNKNQNSAPEHGVFLQAAASEADLQEKAEWLVIHPATTVSRGQSCAWSILLVPLHGVYTHLWTALLLPLNGQEPCARSTKGTQALHHLTLGTLLSPGIQKSRLGARFPILCSGRVQCLRTGFTKARELGGELPKLARRNYHQGERWGASKGSSVPSSTWDSELGPLSWC